MIVVECSQQEVTVNETYPIKPQDLDTSTEPKGFDSLLTGAGQSGQITLLWTFMQLWQARCNWEAIRHDELLAFVDDKSVEIRGCVRSGVIRFIEPRLHALFVCTHTPDGRVLTYAPSHFLVSTYFLWNPAK